MLCNNRMTYQFYSTKKQPYSQRFVHQQNCFLPQASRFFMGQMHISNRFIDHPSKKKYQMNPIYENSKIVSSKNNIFMNHTILSFQSSLCNTLIYKRILTCQMNSYWRAPPTKSQIMIK